MMPWEHILVGYLGFAVVVLVFYRELPTAKETLVVAFASVFPDLIDKPIGWETDVFQTGYALGHSVFFAVPVSIAVAVVAYRRGVPRLGLAFAVGYLLHLPADVVPYYMLGGQNELNRILWPVAPPGGPEYDGFVDGVSSNLDFYLGLFREGANVSYLVTVNAILLVAALLMVSTLVPSEWFTRPLYGEEDSDTAPEAMAEDD